LARSRSGKARGSGLGQYVLDMEEVREPKEPMTLKLGLSSAAELL
jgi:hypothetical protein